MKLEICVDSYESLLNSKNAGANRVELCSALELDGLTPSIGLVDLATSMDEVEVFVMIRPRGGDFCYSDLDFMTISEEIRIFKQRNINGFVFGALNPDGSLNLPMIKEVIDLAYPMPVALHRAFDYSKDGEKDIDKLIGMGIVRILTSGKLEKAPEGIENLKAINEAYGSSIEIMAGAGVNPSNIPEIYGKTGITSYHMSAREPVASPMTFTPSFGYGDKDLMIASFDRVKEAVEILERLS